MSTPKGLFLGLATLDVIQRVARMPSANEKLASTSLTVAAGGPAANAAVAFAALGGEAVLVTRLGSDEAGEVAKAELGRRGVTVVQAQAPAGEDSVATPVAMVLVTEATGERAVVSLTDGGLSRRVAATATSTPFPDAPTLREALTKLAGSAAGGEALRDFTPDTVLADSHHIDLSIRVCEAARREGIATILDCGARKPWTDLQLPGISIPIVSEAFADGDAREAYARLRPFAPEAGAITCGERPVRWWAGSGPLRSSAVAAACAVDTLGAGDFFHGAFAFRLALEWRARIRPSSRLDAGLVESCVDFASQVAARSVRSFGSREWLRGLGDLGTALPHSPDIA